MNFLVVDIENEVEILETSVCTEAIEEAANQVANNVKAELFFTFNDEWYGWTNELGFIGTRPKHPPTR